jgi:EAL domain-containing protein (putative c-di-GMP-specific phosphodiesterase class I)
VARVLDKYDLDPASLDLELSERGVLSGIAEVMSQLHELKNLDVQLSVDDFGAGESAIAYLKDMPIDVLKIDRSYISDLGRGGRHNAITSAMVALGQKLDLTVVAEGVETSEQLAILRKLGCDEYQGFHQLPAVSSEEFVQFIKTARAASGPPSQT